MANFSEDLKSLLSKMAIKRFGLQEQLKELDSNIQTLEQVISEMNSKGLIEPTETDNPYPTKMYVE